VGGHVATYRPSAQPPSGQIMLVGSPACKWFLGNRLGECRTRVQPGKAAGSLTTVERLRLPARAEKAKTRAARIVPISSRLRAVRLLPTTNAQRLQQRLIPGNQRFLLPDRPALQLPFPGNRSRG